MNIRIAQKKDIKSITSITSRCFLLNPKEIHNLILNGTRSVISDFYLTFEDNEATGCFKINQFHTYIRETKIKAGGIGAVAVLPEFRRRGIAEFLMKESLSIMYKEKYPISMLYPFQHKFYRKFGWETAGIILHYRINPNNIHDSNERVYVRNWKPADKPAIKKLYLKKASESSCYLLRNDKFWNADIFSKWKNAAVYENNGLRGYIVYDFLREKNYIKLHINEFIAIDHFAYSGLLAFIANLGEQVYSVEYLAGTEEPFLNFLKEPRENESEKLFFEYRSLGIYAPGFMFRIVNLKEALKCLPGNEKQFRLTFQIEDPFLPENSKPVSLICENGVITITDDYFEESLFKTQINYFSQIYSGAVSASQLKWYGKAECSTKTAEICDSIFSTSKPFIHQYDAF